MCIANKGATSRTVRFLGWVGNGSSSNTCKSIGRDSGKIFVGPIEIMDRLESSSPTKRCINPNISALLGFCSNETLSNLFHVNKFPKTNSVAHSSDVLISSRGKHCYEGRSWTRVLCSTSSAYRTSGSLKYWRIHASRKSDTSLRAASAWWSLMERDIICLYSPALNDAKCFLLHVSAKK